MRGIAKLCGSWLLLAGIMISGVSSRTALAQDVVAQACNGCTDTQMESAALSSGAGFHYVYNLPQAFIARYYVGREDTGDGQWSLMAMPAVPEQWVLDQFVQIHQFYLANGNSLDARYAAPPIASLTGDSINAYDVVSSSASRNAVSQHLSTRFISLIAGGASVARIVRLDGIIAPSVPMTVNVSFPDGSRAIYRFNWDTKQWEYLPGSAVDSHGNSVPEKAADFVNGDAGYAEFDFRNPSGNVNDQSDWINRAIAAGISVTTPTSSRLRWSCVKVGDKGWSCRPI